MRQHLWILLLPNTSTVAMTLEIVVCRRPLLQLFLTFLQHPRCCSSHQSGQYRGQLIAQLDNLCYCLLGLCIDFHTQITRKYCTAMCYIGGIQFSTTFRAEALIAIQPYILLSGYNHITIYISIYATVLAYKLTNSVISVREGFTKKKQLFF